METFLFFGLFMRGLELTPLAPLIKLDLSFDELFVLA